MRNNQPQPVLPRPFLSMVLGPDGEPTMLATSLLQGFVCNVVGFEKVDEPGRRVGVDLIMRAVGNQLLTSYIMTTDECLSLIARLRAAVQAADDSLTAN